MIVFENIGKVLGKGKLRVRELVKSVLGMMGCEMVHFD